MARKNRLTANQRLILATSEQFKAEGVQPSYTELSDRSGMPREQCVSVIRLLVGTGRYPFAVRLVGSQVSAADPDVIARVMAAAKKLYEAGLTTSDQRIGEEVGVAGCTVKKIKLAQRALGLWPFADYPHKRRTSTKSKPRTPADLPDWDNEEPPTVEEIAARCAILREAHYKEVGCRADTRHEHDPMAPRKATRWEHLRRLWQQQESQLMPQVSSASHSRS